MSIAIYQLTSTLHSEQQVEQAASAFLSTLALDYVMCGGDFTSYGTHSLDLIFVRTGGTENTFRELLPALQQASSAPFYLLTSGENNSLAAAMEILSYLQEKGCHGEIIHGSPSRVSDRIRLLAKVEQARRKLAGVRLGIVGEPSDWLISSRWDVHAVKRLLGIELVNIPMEELLSEIELTSVHPLSPAELSKYT